MEKFNISYDTLQQFSYSDTPIPISKIAERINMLIDTEKMKKICGCPMEWVFSSGTISVRLTFCVPCPKSIPKILA